jgi:hypothetical protein
LSGGSASAVSAAHVTCRASSISSCSEGARRLRGLGRVAIYCTMQCKTAHSETLFSSVDRPRYLVITVKLSFSRYGRTALLYVKLSFGRASVPGQIILGRTYKCTLGVGPLAD